jgi:ribose transport system permease protein
MKQVEVKEMLRIAWLKYRALLILALLIVISYVISPSFISYTNFIYLTRLASIIGIASLGMMLTILTGGIDLSVGSMAALSCVLLAYFEHWGIYLGYVEQLSFIAPLPVIYLICLGLGGTLGSLWGFIIGKWRLPDFAITLAALFILKGMAYILPRGQTIFGVDSVTRFIGASTIGPIPFTIFIWIMASVVIYIILNHIPVGKHIYAFGGNPVASEVCGVSRLKVKMLAYAISGMLAALVGVIYAGRTDTGDYRVGEDLLVNSLMATLLGGVNIFGGEGRVTGVIIGTIIVAIIFNVFDLTKLHPYPRDILRGIMLLVILATLIRGEKIRKV